MDPVTTISNGTELMKIIPQLGVGGLFFVAFMFLLKWVLKTQEKILDSSKEERCTSQTVIQGFLKILEQMSMQITENQKQVTEAHNYQRAEHQKMIEELNMICLISQQHENCLEKVKDNLEEQGRVLARINGLKRE